MFSRDIHRPTAENVGDYAYGRAAFSVGDTGDQAVEVGFEGFGGQHEAHDEGVRQGVSVFGVRGEAVIGGSSFEREGAEMDVGVRGE